MRLLLAFLPWACAAGGAGSPATCQDRDKCRSTSDNALFQRKAARSKSAVMPLKDDHSSDEVPDDDAEYNREVAALQEGLGGAGGSAGTSRSAATCDLDLCGPAELIPNRWAGKVDGILWKCRAADDLMRYLADLSACRQAPRQWLDRCCKKLPAPAPTPPPRTSQSLSLCDICPGSKLIWQNFAGKDKRGLYTCTRAHHFANRKAKNRPSCERAVGWWSKACCADKQPKCNICPRGLRDLKRWAPAGKWTGGGRFDQKWVNCKRAHTLVQQSEEPCGRVRRPFMKKCCTSHSEVLRVAAAH